MPTNAIMEVSKVIELNDDGPQTSLNSMFTQAC
jgi:hypothetical protein